MPHSQTAALSIAAAEQETGLSKDVLRVWERRYGFPAPLRDADGDRLYPADQIRRLRLLRILTDLGVRPGKLIALDEAQLAERIATLRQEKCADTSSGAGPANAPVIAHCLGLVADNAPALLEARLNIEIVLLGLERFASEVAAPLCVETGLAWERGDIGVHQEHMFSQVLARSLRQNIERLCAYPAARDGEALPKILLTTPPGEIHELGVLMVHSVLCAQGVACLNFGPQMPLGDVVSATRVHGCTVVALSISSWYDARRAGNILIELRKHLPSAIEIWVGGSNAALRRELPAGIRVFTRLDQIASAVAAVRNQ